jgi:hypothetical protein
MVADKPLKAYRVTILTWPGMVAIYAAPSRAKAIQAAWESAHEAEYNIAWQDHRGHRAPCFDGLAAQAERSGACLGWSYDMDGTSFGCLRPADDQVRHLIGYALLNCDLQLEYHEDNGVPLAKLGEVATVCWVAESLRYRVFGFVAAGAIDFERAADAAEYLKGITCPA